jgi:hypothetical protein
MRAYIVTTQYTHTLDTQQATGAVVMILQRPSISDPAARGC